MNSFQEVRYEANTRNPVSRAGNACCCSIFGIFMLFPAALILVGWNEQRTVCVERAVLAAEQALSAVPCEAQPRDHQGELVFASCAVSDESLKRWSPADFAGLQALDGLFEAQALRARVHAEMYQCIEEKQERSEKSRDGKETRTITTYSYKLAWQSRWVDSSQFKNHKEAQDARWHGCGGTWDNPAFSVNSETKNSGTLRAGSFDVTRHLQQVPAEEPIALRPLPSQGSWMYDGRQQPPPKLEAVSTMISGNYLYTCDTRNDIPQGCMRMSFRASSASQVSMLARLNADGSSRAWRAPATWMCSSSSSSNSIDFFAPRAMSADEAIDELLSSNDAMKWILRVVGFLMAWAGIHCFLQPVQALADAARDTMGLLSCLPVIGWLLDFLGDVVSGAVGCALTLLSLGVAAPAVLLVMSAMWIVMRPLLGAAMLVAGLVGIAIVSGQMGSLARLGRERKGKQA